MLMAGLVFLSASSVGAEVLNPPTIPTVFYGNVTIDGQPAASGSTIVINALVDGAEIGRFVVEESGLYFIETICGSYVGQPVLLKVNSLIAEQTVCSDATLSPSMSIDLVVNMHDVLIDEQTESVVIPDSLSAEQAAKITFNTITPNAAGQITAVVGSGGLSINRLSSKPDNNFQLYFSANTVISGPNDWDGSLMAPTVSNLAVVVPTEPGFNNQIIQVVNVGLVAANLFFDRPVSLVLPNMADKEVGFSIDGSDFNAITNQCAVDSGDSLVGDWSECRFNRGVDLVIWTKHFTNFVVFSKTPVSSSGGSGGAVLNQSWCSSVEYTDWQDDCVADWQYRGYAALHPQGCQATVEQQLAAKRFCQTQLMVEEPYLLLESQQLETVADNDKQVLGVKNYPDGSLLRNSRRQIFVIREQAKYHIRTLWELSADYFGQPIIDVADDVLSGYRQVFLLSAKFYPDGSLLRNSRQQIFVVRGLSKHHVRTLSELATNYFGQRIIDVADYVLTLYK